MNEIVLYYCTVLADLVVPLLLSAVVVFVAIDGDGLVDGDFTVFVVVVDG